ncbi:MAG: outer membrane beta-barrel protein [Bacteroidota bacterium]
MRTSICLILLASILQTALAQDDFPFVLESKGKFLVGLHTTGVSGAIGSIRTPEGRRLLSTTNGLQAGYFFHDHFMVQVGAIYSHSQFNGTLGTLSTEANLRYVYPVWRLHLYGQAGLVGSQITRNTLNQAIELPERGLATSLRFGILFHLNQRWSLESSYGFNASIYNNIGGWATRSAFPTPVRLGVNFRI